MATLLQDVRYGLRMLAKNPAFTAVAVLTLALGIGANTAIFSVVNAVLLRPLPYRQSDHLVKVWGNFSGIGIPGDRNWISAPEFKDLETQNKSFSGIAATTSESFNLGINGTPQRIEGYLVSPSLFELLGVQPFLGRAFLQEEATPGRDREVLLSYGLWKRGFGGDTGIVGKQIVINDLNVTVVGVMPASFEYPDDAEMWAPLALAPSDFTPDHRGNHGLEVLARIRPELSLAQARADMSAVTKIVEQQNPAYPYARFNFAFTLTPLLAEMVSDVQKALWILTAAVGLVLLIACANVANLLLVRASNREREIAIRVALGGARKRIVAQLLTESVLLALLGGFAGILLARWGLDVLVNLSATIFPRVAAASMDGRVLLFSTLISVATGIIFGLAPALHSSRGVRAESLKEGGRGATVGSVSQRLRHSLIVAELALSLVLLSGAGLLIKSFLRLQEVDGGFRPDHVLTMRISLPETKYSKPEQIRAFYRDVLDRISTLPGVQAAGAVNLLPLSGGSTSGTTTIDTTAVPPDSRTPECDLRVVTPDFFKAMSVKLIRGRFFAENDNDQSPPVAIVDQSLANTYWPGEDAIGKRLHLGGVKSTAPWMTIVGVVAHVRYRTLEEMSRAEVYWPEAQRASSSLSLAIRTAGDPLALAPSVQKAVQSVDPEQPVYSVRSMDTLLENSLARRRLSLLLLAIFAAAALLLAAVGIYGIMSYWVSQRSHEMGIRMALGASRVDVLRLVLRQGLVLAGVGVFAGLVGSLVLTRFIASLLFAVKPTDPATFLVVAVALGAVAVAASFIPAHRATRVAPMKALRYE